MNKMLSEEIIEKTFDSSRQGVFGSKPSYDKNEVDEYLQDVASEVEKIESQNKKMKKRIELLEQERVIQSENIGGEQPTFKDNEEFEQEKKRRLKQLETMDKSLRRLLLMAESEAEKVREEAKGEARALLESSKKKAEQLVSEALKKHDEVNVEAENIIEEAENRRRMIIERYEEVKNEMKNIHDFIEKIVLNKRYTSETKVDEEKNEAIS